jgi:hypothetical protein
VPHFPIYNLRRPSCRRISRVVPDAVIERAMRHTSPETKRSYRHSMVEQVHEAMEKASQRVCGGHVTVHRRVLQDTHITLAPPQLLRENRQFVTN